MRRVLAVGVLTVILCPSMAWAATYSEILGDSEIRSFVEKELDRHPDLTFEESAKSWLVAASGRVEAREETDAQTAARELREGLREFVGAFAAYAQERNVGRVTRQNLVEFQITAAKCGMIPCSPRCCRRCEPC